MMIPTGKELSNRKFAARFELEPHQPLAADNPHDVGQRGLSGAAPLLHGHEAEHAKTERVCEWMHRQPRPSNRRWKRDHKNAA
jgi:hypothetical protein